MSTSKEECPSSPQPITRTRTASDSESDHQIPQHHPAFYLKRGSCPAIPSASALSLSLLCLDRTPERVQEIWKAFQRLNAGQNDYGDNDRSSGSGSPDNGPVFQEEQEEKDYGHAGDGVTRKPRSRTPLDDSSFVNKQLIKTRTNRYVIEEGMPVYWLDDENFYVEFPIIDTSSVESDGYLKDASGMICAIPGQFTDNTDKSTDNTGQSADNTGQFAITPVLSPDSTNRLTDKSEQSTDNAGQFQARPSSQIGATSPSPQPKKSVQFSQTPLKVYSTYWKDEYDRRNLGVDPFASFSIFELERRLEKMDVFEIEINKSEDGRLGFDIIGMGLNADRGDDKLSIFIKSITPGGLAERDGRLNVWDQIVEVDGESLVGVSQHYAAYVLRNTSGRVKLKVARDKDAENSEIAGLCKNNNQKECQSKN